MRRRPWNSYTGYTGEINLATAESDPKTDHKIVTQHYTTETVWLFEIPIAGIIIIIIIIMRSFTSWKYARA